MGALEGQEPTGYSRFFESDPKKSCSRVQLVPGHMEVNSLELPWAWSVWEELLCCSPSAEEALEEAGWGSHGVGEDFQLLGASHTSWQLPFIPLSSLAPLR